MSSFLLLQWFWRVLELNNLQQLVIRSYLRFLKIFIQYVIWGSARWNSGEWWSNVILDVITAAVNLWDRSAVCNVWHLFDEEKQQALPILSVKCDLSPYDLHKAVYIFGSYLDSYYNFSVLSLQMNPDSVSG